MATSSRRVRLDRYRTGREPCVDLTSVELVQLPDPEDGQVLVRATHLLLTAVIADVMREEPGLTNPGIGLGGTPMAAVVGEVVTPGVDGLPAGTAVAYMGGWAEHTLGDPSRFTPLPDALPAPYYALNQGATAYAGMVDVAAVGPGDVVFVSGATGGVGSMAGQIAKASGATTVIGSAGGPDKGRYLTDELHFDVALDHRAGDIEGQLRRAAPDGIDVFFDLVGGEQFEAAVQVAAEGARFALCGAVSGQLDDGDGAHPRLDLMTAIVKNLHLLAFAAPGSPDVATVWNEHYARWLADGRIVFSHTVVEGGVDVVARTLDELLAGRHRGNVLVAL